MKEWVEDVQSPSGWRWNTGEAPVGDQYQAMATVVPADQPAVTSGEQDHSNPWIFAGDDAEAPVNP